MRKLIYICSINQRQWKNCSCNGIGNKKKRKKSPTIVTYIHRLSSPPPRVAPPLRLPMETLLILQETPFGLEGSERALPAADNHLPHLSSRHTVNFVPSPTNQRVPFPVQQIKRSAFSPPRPLRQPSKGLIGALDPLIRQDDIAFFLKSTCDMKPIDMGKILVT